MAAFVLQTLKLLLFIVAWFSFSPISVVLIDSLKRPRRGSMLAPCPVSVGQVFIFKELSLCSLVGGKKKLRRCFGGRGGFEGMCTHHPEKAIAYTSKGGKKIGKMLVDSTC